ncbi:PREDICTED: amiloride-sensitive sodium channel subunit beta-like [Priapulus caudatus]|uniref:Amiloride-sensitive sodium channel subunit beta-like n=1 Tax=Priapulus caudatus TaxID=37621 RepID=A0ABM1ETX1_PRICU|nr:PREDICTED: amiloride-sensitive sodium channel subunit beta-like [Priapulus caudatus]
MVHMETATFVAPETSTHVSFQRTLIERKKRPEQDCIMAEEVNKAGVYHDVFAEVYGTDYTVRSCLKTCSQKKAVKICDCYMLSTEIPLTDAMLGNARSAASVSRCNGTELNACVLRIINGTYDSDPCLCPPPCHEVQTEAVVTSAPMTTLVSASENEQLLELLKTAGVSVDVMERYEARGIVVSSPAFAVDTYSRLYIRFRDTFDREIREEFAFTSSDLGANIGGLLGLYIGLSILTVYEVIEFLYDICVLLVRKAKPKSVKI